MEISELKGSLEVVKTMVGAVPFAGPIMGGGMGLLGDICTKIEVLTHYMRRRRCLLTLL